MKLYDAELSVAGLADRIQNNRSVAFYSAAEPFTSSNSEIVIASHKVPLQYAKASLNDPDLYHTKSILCTTAWNKNDDVFLKSPTWAARHTAEHKRTDLEHNEAKIVGHITDTWIIDGDGKIVADDTELDKVPDFFHVANGAVIYLAWADKELKARAASLVEAIEEGDMCVSMEAGFNNFDYAVQMPDTEEVHIIARSKDTAFLSKHLRIYGGDGQYEGCKLGRVLQDIIFCGKGYVKRPANPYSVILSDESTTASHNNSVNMSKIVFASEQENPFKKRSGVFISSSSTLNNTDTELNMDLEQKNKELEATVASLKAQIEQLSKAGIDSKISTLEATVATLQKQNDTANTTVATLTAKVEELTAASTKANELALASEQAKANAEAKLAQIEAEAKTAARVNVFVAAGYSKEDAAAKVAVFASLNDEQFNVVAAEVAKAAKPAADEKSKKDKKEDMAQCSESDASVDDAGETVATEANQALNNAKPTTEAAMTTAAESTVSEAESVRHELSMAFASRFGRRAIEVSDEEDTDDNQ